MPFSIRGFGATQPADHRDPPASLSVLIVEDDEDARVNLCDILALDGHRVTAVDRAAAVLQGDVDLSQIDVVILDRKLPDGMAEDILPRIRHRAPHVVAIIVTAFANMQSTIAAMREGAVDYILKPIDPAALRNSLNRLAERRRMELLLQEERQFAEKVLRTAEAVVVVLDVEGRVIRFNPYLTERTGVPLADAQGKDWFDLFIPEEHRDSVREVFRRTVNHLESRGVINPIHTASGERCDIRWSNTTLKDEDQRVVAVLSVGLDVTDLLRAQEKLLQSERLAAIGRTMTGLAHETRNALQRLQNALELLEMQLEGQQEALHDLARIQRAANDIRRLLEEVRSYAAPIQLSREVGSVALAWRSAWQDLQPRRDRRQVLFREELPENEPRVRMDYAKLGQVFRNIFENALDACADPISLDVSCRIEGDKVRVAIRDNGPGIHPQHREKAFDAFHTTKPTGTGLGLSIAKRIVEAHEGTIEVDHSPPGACFVIVLPRVM